MPRLPADLPDYLSDHVLFVDGESLVIDKPAGLPVTTPRNGGMSVEKQLTHLRFGFQRLPMIVHRLDQDTSGCLLLARNPKAQKRFNLAFEEGRVEKSYLALLDGVPEEEAGEIDLPLAKISSAEQGWRMVADPKGKSAQTHWALLGVYGGKALVRFTPQTGRTHQLRVHAATGLGLPITGDAVYGAGRGPLMLHASGLSLLRDGKATIQAEAPLPAHFLAAGISL